MAKAKQLSTRKSFRDFADCLKDRQAFNTYGALYGTDVTVGRGRLDIVEYGESFDQADYAVYSYATPIAWHLPTGEWVMPDDKYSVTTTRHQGKILVALCTFTEVR